MQRSQCHIRPSSSDAPSPGNKQQHLRNPPPLPHLFSFLGGLVPRPATALGRPHAGLGWQGLPRQPAINKTSNENWFRHEIVTAAHDAKGDFHGLRAAFLQRQQSYARAHWSGWGPNRWADMRECGGCGENPPIPLPSLIWRVGSGWGPRRALLETRWASGPCSVWLLQRTSDVLCILCRLVLVVGYLDTVNDTLTGRVLVPPACMYYMGVELGCTYVVVRYTHTHNHCYILPTR
jgi:hypothetical protein